MTPDASVYWHDEVDSTNEQAKRLAQSGDYGPRWIAAHKQSAGRGRLGRSWVSPTGNLYVTALFVEPSGISSATRYPFAAGLAIIDACKVFLPAVRAELKWPNDVRVDGAKLCGILVEAGSIRPANSAWVAVGMGINIQSSPENAGQSATNLCALGANPAVDAQSFLQALIATFERRARQARENFSSLLKDWEQAAEGLGKMVSVGKDPDKIHGRFKELASDGALVLELADGTSHTVRAGDVELIREISDDAARN